MSRLLVCGSNSGHQLGLGHDRDIHTLIPAIQSTSGLPFPPPGSRIEQLSSGANHTVVILVKEGKRELWCTGTAEQGQLGPQTEVRTAFQRLQVIKGQPILVACGWNCTYLVLSHTLISLGFTKYNTFGELGVPSEQGAIHHINLPSGARVVKLAAGLRHAVILVLLDQEIQLLGWGSARHGQIGAVPSKSCPGPSTAIVTTPQLIQAWPWTPTTRLDLAAGKDHTVALIGTRVYAFGSNKQGQCTIPSDEVQSLTCNWNGTSYLLCSGKVIGYGNNTKGQLSFSKANDIGTIASGSEHTLLLSNSSRLLGTGWNEHGNLSQSDCIDRSYPVPLHSHTSQIWAGCGTTFLTVSFPYLLPKIELHAHLNGSIRLSTLQELSGGLSSWKPARNMGEAFKMFDMIHSAVTKYEHVERIAREMCEDMKQDGVVYAEIRTTPRDLGEGKESYVKAVLRGVEGKVRVLLSVDRKSRSTAEETVDLAIKYRGKGVIGIDLSGNPSLGEWQEWRPALERARGVELKITLHAGELREKDDEMRQMIHFKPDRFGHCCFVSPENAVLLKQSRVPIELCLTSNILTGSVPDYINHHFTTHYRPEPHPGSRNPVILCTDDSAVFGSTLSNEYRIAMKTYELGERETFVLAKEAMQASFLQRQDEHVWRHVEARFDLFEKQWFGAE